jgi:hypothetical protein
MDTFAEPNEDSQCNKGTNESEMEFIHLSFPQRLNQSFCIIDAFRSPILRHARYNPSQRVSKSTGLHWAKANIRLRKNA